MILNLMINTYNLAHRLQIITKYNHLSKEKMHNPLMRHMKTYDDDDF